MLARVIEDDWLGVSLLLVSPSGNIFLNGEQAAFCSKQHIPVLGAWNAALQNGTASSSSTECCHCYSPRILLYFPLYNRHNAGSKCHGQTTLRALLLTDLNVTSLLRKIYTGQSLKQ